MKLLVSDYDGTLNPNKNNTSLLSLNIEAIHRFREQGNKFVLATGRYYESIKKQIDMYNIPYDYLSCYDGGVIYDNNGKVLNSTHLNTNEIVLLFQQLMLLPVTEGIRIYNELGITNTFENLVELSVKLKRFKSKKELYEIIKKYKNLDTVLVHNILYIESSGGKSRSIEYLRELHQFDQVITVGDGNNDIGMLTNYEGYKMPNSHYSLYFKGIKTIPSVKTLVYRNLI